MQESGMKKAIFMATAFLLTMKFSALPASSPDEIRQLLEAWGPKTVRTGVLVIVLPQRRITETIFAAVINTGICMFGVGLGRLNLDGVSEIWVLNQFERQGYVYEGGAAGCAEIKRAPKNVKRVALLGMSRLF